MEQAPFRHKSRFTEFFAAANRLDIKEWAFLPGMLFAAPAKWWGDMGRRAAPHEGVDFCFYADRSGEVLHIGGGARVPVMCRGVVVAIIDDFLGRSVVVAHDPPGTDALPFLTIYGHTIPMAGLASGVPVKEGDVIATVAPKRRLNDTVRPHLHVSAGALSGLVPLDSLDWKNMGEALLFSDPLDLFPDRHRLIERV